MTGRPPAGAVLLPFPAHVDPRGSLVELDFRQLPFVPRRIFLVAGAVAGTSRGGHAHKHGQQLLVCVSGTVEVETVHLGGREVHVLESPTRALLVPERVWSRQIFREAGSRLLVLASHPYDPDSYVEDLPAVPP